MNDEDVYWSIRAAIVSGDFHPNERLVEADMAARFGAARTAIRTALVRLDAEGLVTHERNRGARVRLVSEQEAVEIYEARGMLEALAARKAAENASSEQIAELKNLLASIKRHIESGELAEASDDNASLHAAVLAVSGHATAARLVSSLNTYVVRFQYRTILHPGRPQKSLAEHRAIVEAIAKRSPDDAERAMRAHLSTITDTLHLPAPGRGFD